MTASVSSSIAVDKTGLAEGPSTGTATALPTDTHDVEYYNKFPNTWSKIRHIFREPAAEFFGTMILCLVGTAGNAQGVLFNSSKVSTSPAGGWDSVAFGWAAGISLGVWVCAGISGGHVNPAVTITLATFRDFPWKKVPIYIIAQLLGGIVGAGITYANYIHAIDLYEGGRHIRTVPGTASLFGCYATSYMTNVSAFFDQFLGTFLLLISILAVTDKRNGPPPAGLVPLVLFIVFIGLGYAFGAQTGFAVNPARDLGPRILTAMVGYGRAVFNFRHQYWLWCGVCGPIAGGLTAGFVYDAFIFTGQESLFNKPNSKARDVGAHAPLQERQKMPAGIEIV